MFDSFDWNAALADSPILMILVLCSVVTAAFALERLIYFRRRGGDADGALGSALSLIGSAQLNQAIGLCRGLDHPFGEVASEALQSQQRAPGETEEVMQVVLSRQKLLLERNMGMLGTMAAVAPLIGLLGTVWGIMRAFHAMSAAGNADPSVVAAGVAEALTTTAAGLVIAVPAVMLYNHFNRRMNTMLTVAENHTRSLLVAVREHAKGARRTGAAPIVHDADSAQTVPAQGSCALV